MNKLLPIFILVYLLIGIIIVMAFRQFARDMNMKYGNATIILTILLWPYLAAMSASEAIQGFKEIRRERKH